MAADEVDLVALLKEFAAAVSNSDAAMFAEADSDPDQAQTPAESLDSLEGYYALQDAALDILLRTMHRVAGEVDDGHVYESVQVAVGWDWFGPLLLERAYRTVPRKSAPEGEVS